jgi:hypothetical protein
LKFEQVQKLRSLNFRQLSLSEGTGADSMLILDDLPSSASSSFKEPGNPGEDFAIKVLFGPFDVT